MPFQSQQPGQASPFMTRLRGTTRSYLGTGVHRAGMGMMKDSFGFGPVSEGAGKLGRGVGLLGRATGIGFAGYTAYRGYQEGGVWGAAKATGAYALESYAVGAGIRAIVGTSAAAFPVALGAAAVAGGMYGRAKAHTIGKERYRRHTKVEMGTPIVDSFGTAATMRQRSLQALNNSRLNGMTALGNEATLLYRPYAR